MQIHEESSPGFARQETRRLLALASPILTGSVFTHLTILFNTVLIGMADRLGLLMTGLFLPFSFLVTAVIESFRAPTVALAAQSQRKDEPRDGILILAALAAILLLGVAGLAAVFQRSLFLGVDIPGADIVRARQFIVHMLCASSLLAAGAVINSGLLALGRGRAAMLLSVFANLINISVTAAGAFWLELGAQAAVLGACCAGIFMIAGAYCRLPRFARMAGKARASSFRRTVALAVDAGMPVLASYLLLCAYLALMNHVMIMLGTAAVGGFGLVSRLQNLLMLPAAALGTALAIRAGQLHGAMNTDRVLRLVRQACVLTVTVYLLVAVVVCAGHRPVGQMLTGDPAARDVVYAYLLTVGPTYIFFGPLLTLLIYLDQVGQGRTALYFNALSLGGTIAAAYYAAVHYGDFLPVFLTIAAANIVSSALMFMLISRAKLHRPHPRLLHGGTP
jgi:Na+-driven multidrug efflux pump